MNQQIDSKVIFGIIGAIVVVLGIVIYRSVTAPSASVAASNKKAVVTPPTMPSEDDLRKMREARNSH